MRRAVIDCNLLCRVLQIGIVGFAEQKFYLKARFITDGAYQLLRLLLGAVIDTDDAALLLTEQGCLCPTDVIGNTILQESALYHLFTLFLYYLAELNFVIYFHICI